MLWWRGHHQSAKFFETLTVGEAVRNLLAKWILGRPRPAFWVSLAPEAWSSFPSGPAMGRAALAMALGVLLTRWRGWWLALVAGDLVAVGLGFSRLYLGVHYPSGVLAGCLATMGWVTSTYLVSRLPRLA